jgi:hypothetical protein
MVALMPIQIQISRGQGDALTARQILFGDGFAAGGVYDPAPPDPLIRGS